MVKDPNVHNEHKHETSVESFLSCIGEICFCSMRHAHSPLKVQMEADLKRSMLTAALATAIAVIVQIDNKRSKI